MLFGSRQPPFGSWCKRLLKTFVYPGTGRTYSRRSQSSSAIVYGSPVKPPVSDSTAPSFPFAGRDQPDGDLPHRAFRGSVVLCQITRRLFCSFASNSYCRGPRPLVCCESEGDHLLRSIFFGGMLVTLFSFPPSFCGRFLWAVRVSRKNFSF